VQPSQQSAKAKSRLSAICGRSLAIDFLTGYGQTKNHKNTKFSTKSGHSERKQKSRLAVVGFEVDKFSPG
jgi:hypothetical protein